MQISSSESQWDLLEGIRLEATCAIQEKHRRDLGQVFTPTPVARLLADSFTTWGGRVELLDGGAGAGTLSAAAALTALERSDGPTSLRVTAWELDPAMIVFAKRSLDLVAELYADAGVPFEYEVREEDFILAAAEGTVGLFAHKAAHTHAILNPPYAKLGASSLQRAAAERLGAPVPNLYAAFMLAASNMLCAGGEMVAITPRSFCNGPYFRRFRRSLLAQCSLSSLRVFESRSSAFSDQAVLQENVVSRFIRSETKPAAVIVQVGDVCGPLVERTVPADEVVFPEDLDSVIHIAESQDAIDAAALMHELPCTLSDLGLQVSTGPVVDFRNADWLRTKCDDGSVPLLYPGSVSSAGVTWPPERGKKPQGIARVDETASVLTCAGCYVLVKRFSSKEERRRVVAAALLPDDVAGYSEIGLENHLNYIHACGEPLGRAVARGLAAFLNLAFVDRYFRSFSGHTQVNASDIRRLRFPSAAALEQIGSQSDPEVSCEEWIGDFNRRLSGAVSV